VLSVEAELSPEPEQRASAEAVDKDYLKFIHSFVSDNKARKQKNIKERQTMSSEQKQQSR